MTTYETVLLDMQDNVATLTLNRPERRNALNEALNVDLLAALQAVARDEAVRAVVLTGAGESFCSGADLTVFQSLPSPQQVYDGIWEQYQPVIMAITTMPKPVIALVNGIAAGAGASLALACDLRVMAHDAALLLAFSNIGLVPDAGATWFLARLVGYSRAFEIAAQGERITAEQCLALGLTNKVVPAPNLAEIGAAWARNLAERPTLALGMTKQALQHALLHDLPGTIDFEARLQGKAVASADFQEGLAAFAEKRRAVFNGGSPPLVAGGVLRKVMDVISGGTLIRRRSTCVPIPEFVYCTISPIW